MTFLPVGAHGSGLGRRPSILTFGLACFLTRFSLVSIPLLSSFFLFEGMIALSRRSGTALSIASGLTDYGISSLALPLLAAPFSFLS